MKDTRRGFSLIELLVAMILLFIVGGGIYSLLITVQRVSKRQTEMANVQGNLRSGMQLIQSELQEITTDLSGSKSDISAMSTTAMTYRAMRGVGETCGTPTTTSVTVRASNYWGLRLPTGGRDSALIYFDKDTTKITDDSWLPLGVSVRGNSTCPDGKAAYALSVIVDPDSLAKLVAVTDVPSAGLGSIPIRFFEPMQVGQVTSNGQVWLGIRSLKVTPAENSLVPVIGPLTSNGVFFEYLDKDGNSTLVTSQVKTIRLTLRGISDRTVTTGLGSTIGNPQDSLRLTIQLRNSR